MGANRFSGIEERNRNEKDDDEQRRCEILRELTEGPEKRRILKKGERGH